MERTPIAGTRTRLQSIPLRRATLLVALLVAAYVPFRQWLADGAPPELTKPVLAGVLCGVVIASLAALPRHWNLKFFLMCCMGLLSLGLAESIAGRFVAADRQSIYDWDDRCLYKPLPNSHKFYRRTAINGGQINEVAINSQGFRGPDLLPASDLPRVMVYGDSFIEAEYSRFEDTFGEQLRRTVTQQLKEPLEVINAGVNGYGPDQAFMRMESELSQFRPQVVILSVFADNDYGDLLRNKLFRLNERDELVANSWHRSPRCRHPGMTARYEPVLWKLGRNALGGFRGEVHSYMERWRLQCRAEFEEFVTQGNSEVHDLQADHYDADVALTPGVTSARYKAMLFKKVLARVAALCRKNEARLLLLVIPSPADLIENYDFCAIDRGQYPNYDPRALTKIAVDAGRKANVEVVNLFDPFAKHDPQTLYFQGGDNHWNDAGQQLAAQIVAPVLIRLLQTK